LGFPEAGAETNMCYAVTGTLAVPVSSAFARSSLECHLIVPICRTCWRILPNSENSPRRLFAATAARPTEQSRYVLFRGVLAACGKFPVENGTGRHLSLLAACGGAVIFKRIRRPLHQPVLRSQAPPSRNANLAGLDKVDVTWVTLRHEFREGPCALAAWLLFRVGYGHMVMRARLAMWVVKF
jgi:hypothetical protein